MPQSFLPLEQELINLCNLEKLTSNGSSKMIPETNAYVVFNHKSFKNFLLKKKRFKTNLFVELEFGIFKFHDRLQLNFPSMMGLTCLWSCVFNFQLPQFMRQPRGSLLRIWSVPATLQSLPLLLLRQASAPPAAALHGNRNYGQH